MSKQSKQVNGPKESLLKWLEEYHSSVGDAADLCGPILTQLLNGSLKASDARGELFDLLKLLETLSADPRTVACAMVFIGIVHGEKAQDWNSALPAAVRDQLQELLRLKQFESENLVSSTERSAEGLRRLLLALVKDVRVVLIALAWQLVQLRRAKGEAGLARILARETLMIHAPLANRLGVWHLKWELEDLAFRFMEPESYRRIAKLVAERRTDRERFIGEFISKLESALLDSGIRGDVLGRPKHIYSIWKKMQRKGLDFHELFDVRAVRVLVDDLPTCYSALGVVHSLWQPVPGEFDDYITTPKGNNYQSLHTAVVGPEGKAVEVQIRTEEMHQHAELGVAAHWRYKEGGPNDPAFDNKIAVMRQLLDAGEDRLDDESLLDSFQVATSEDRVYVLTPGGQVIDLALGSTVLDFAYHVHTEVGHRCQGAKVNGRIVPLTHQVKTGDRVEILTGKHPRPSRDWLNPRLGFIHGARGRSKVRQWFKQESREDNLRQGRDLVEAELKRMSLESEDLDGVADRFSLGKLDDVFVAVGNGDLTVSQVVHAAERMRNEDALPTAEDLVTRSSKRQRAQRTDDAGDIKIEGVGNLMTSIARCCQPVPGDSVVGYVTQLRGVTIHREDCRNALRWQQEDNPRLLEVRWGGEAGSQYLVEVLVRAYDRRDLIRDISAILTASEVSVADISTRRDDMTEEVEIKLHARVRDYEQLSDMLSRLGGVRNVLEARRLKTTH